MNDQKRSLLLTTAKTCDQQEFESELTGQEPGLLNYLFFKYYFKINNNKQILEEFEENSISPNELPNMLETIEKENDQMRNISRPNTLFNYYPAQQQNDLLNVESRLLPGPPIEHTCNRILVKCTQLKFELEIEPVWASMCLYDLKEKRKVSENFAFDLNTDSIKHMLNTHQTHEDPSSLTKSCIFNVTYPSADLFLVVRIEKVLQQGDISECVEPYIKVQSSSALEKLQLNANQFCERLGKYRMPFVWTAINIMSLLNSSHGKESGSLGNSANSSINMSNEVGNQPKSASLDRRFVKSSLINNNTNELRMDDKIEELDIKDEDLNDLNDAEEFCVAVNSKSAPQALKNAYESFRKSSVVKPDELNKRNSTASASQSFPNKTNSSNGKLR